MNTVRLSTPGRLAGLELSNRLVFPPVLTNFTCDTGEVSDRQLDFYRRRAAGGYGLIMTEASYVVPQGGVATRQLAIYDDRFVPGLRRLADAIHYEGSRFGIQLFVDGAGFSYAPKESLMVGPTDLSPWNGPRMHPLSAEEMADLASDFAQAASFAVTAGVDLIELHMAHGHLLGRYLSSYFNRRADEYGGSVQNRTRFPLAVLAYTRARIGTAIPITCRLSLSERLPRGTELPEAVAVVRILRAGGLDGVHVSVGAGTAEGRASIFPTSFSAEAPFRQWASELRVATDCPVLFAGNIHTPQMAEHLITGGFADFISVGRAGIADPDWPRKAMDGDTTDLVPCIGCNQGCVDRLLATREMTCTVNPWVGFERSQSMTSQLAKQPEFFVVGGGIAGLVLALTLAGRGALVTLFEEKPFLGGQFKWAAEIPGKHRYGEYLQYVISHVRAARISVHLNHAVQPEDISGVAADRIFWAGGSVPREWGGLAVSMRVLTSWEFLMAPHLVSDSRVMILGAGQVGCDIALLLAASRCSVTLVDRSSDPLMPLGSRRYDYERALVESGVDLRFQSEIADSIGAEIYLHGPSTTDTLRPDVIISAVGRIARRRPSFLDRAIALGDGLEPRTALEAVHDAMFHGCGAV